MFKPGTLFLTGMFYAIFCNAQTVTWPWAAASNGDNIQTVTAVTTDINNNVLITGNFDGFVCNFPPYGVSQPGNQSDFFVAKYSQQGSVLWAASTDSVQQNIAPTGIACDNAGSVYVAGLWVGNRLHIGPVVITMPDSFQTQNLLLLKYNADGVVQWIKTSVYAQNSVSATAIAISPDNSIYVCGYFSGSSVQFGNTVLNNPRPDNGYISFLLKYDTAGNVKWAKTPGAGSGGSYFSSMTTDNTGNLYVTGQFGDDSMVLDHITLHTSVPGNLNLFMAKFDSSGHAVWAITPSQNRTGLGYSIAADNTGHVYVTGYFYSSAISFGIVFLPNTNNIHPLSDLFVACLDTNGNLQWLKGAGANQSLQATGISVDGEGHAYITGYTAGDTIVIGNQVLTQPPGPADFAFVATYDSSGNLLCAERMNTEGYSPPVMGGCNANSAYVAGGFSGSCQLGNNTLSLSGGENAFVAKFSCSGLAGITPVTENGASLALYPNPFSANATVQYTLSAEAKTASLIVYDLLGRQRSRYELSATAGEITIHAGGLSAGVYLYSLVADGITIATQKMVVE